MTSCSCADVSLFSICQRVAPHHTTGASPGFRLHRVFAAALALVATPEHVQRLVEEVRRATGSRFTIVVDTACSGVLMRFDVNRRQSQGSDTTCERPLAEQYTHKDGSPHGVSVSMLFGSPLPHMPTSLHDSSAAHLSMSPNRGITHSGAFSPSPFHTLFQSPSGATLDDSPYQSLSHPPAKHSPVSAAAQHTAAQASRQAAAGQAQGQRSEQQSHSLAMDASERSSTGMLVPMPAPVAAPESKPQVT